MATTVSTTIGNPTRTAGQGGVALFIVETIEAFNWYHFDARQYGIAIIVFGAVVSLVQNLGENRGWWRAVLRTVPPTETPVVDEIVTKDPTGTLGSDGPVQQTDNRPRDVDPDEQVSQDPSVAYGELDLS